MWRDSGSSLSSQCMVHHQAALRRDLAENANRLGAFGHGALEVRNAADDVRTPMSSARLRLSSAPALLSRPSCGKATSCRSRWARPAS